MIETRWSALILLIWSSLTTSAQNLVQNPSFEIYPNCPNSRNDGRLPFNWIQPTDGTADYFNTCVTGSGTNLPDVPINFVGNQNARTGNAYIGVYVNLESSGQFAGYREYMQSTLISNLVAGRTYKFEMFVSLADESQFAANNLGVYLSSQQISANNSNVLNVTPQITFTGFVTDKNNWTKISGNYTAIGGERYITVGSFSANNSTHLQSVAGGSGGGWNRMCYYYIDDISIVPDCSNIDTLTDKYITTCAGPSDPTTLSSSITGTNYLWNTGANSKTITTLLSGMYTIKTLVDPCYVYDTIYLTRKESPTFVLVKDTAICSNSSQPIFISTEQAQSNYSYLWNTNDTTPGIFISNEGVYKITVTKNNCSITDSVNVRKKYPPNINIGKDTIVCYNSFYNINALTPQASYIWNTGSTQSNITVNEGLYWVEVTVNGCSALDSLLVTNKPNPNLNIGNDSSICPYQPITLNASAANAQGYRWFDGTVGPIYNHVGGGTFWVEILKDGCTYLDTVLLTNKLLPIVDLGPDKTICNTDTITLSTNTANAVKYLWSTGQTLAEIEVGNIGEYWISVTDKSGCYNTDTIKIDTFVSPFVFIGNDDAFCEGTSYTIVCDKVFDKYLWQDGSRNSSITTVLGGKYYVEVTDNNNCKATDTIALTMYPRPTIFTNRIIKVCRQDTLLQIAGNFSSALWNDGTTAFQLLAKNIGEFSVEVTDTLGCKNKTEIKVISSCPASIYIPNVFSPNNDGSNDVFRAYVTDVNKYNLKIYSRWGTLVFETTDFNKSWDGTFESTQAPNDAYIYLITYTGEDGISGTINGNVTLIR